MSGYLEEEEGGVMWRRKIEIVMEIEMKKEEYEGNKKEEVEKEGKEM